MAHPADVAVEATGPTLAAAFASAAEGLAAAHVESIPGTGERFEVEVEAEGLEALLFDFLDRLIYERDVRNVLPVDLEVDLGREGDGWWLRASARGVPVEDLRAREVKAVTYSEMAVEETEAGWRVYVVFDV